MSKHIPRRSGSGPRPVLVPREPKPPRRQFGPARGPEVCGAQHPDLDLTCTGETHIEEAATGALLSHFMGIPPEAVKIQHRGKHRARPLAGVVIRWDDDEVPA